MTGMIAITSGLRLPPLTIEDQLAQLWADQVPFVVQPRKWSPPRVGSQGTCGRTARSTGRPRRMNRASDVYAGYGVACMSHLTADEREAWDAVRKEHLDHRNAEAEADEPACWSWPISAEIRVRLQSEDWKEREDAFYDWHEDRCAICGGGRTRDLVLDHCHESGMVRGYLDRGCNISEGSSGAPVFRKYCEWPPAFILNHCIEYRSPFGLPAISVFRSDRATEAGLANMLSDLFHDDEDAA